MRDELNAAERLARGAGELVISMGSAAHVTYKAGNEGPVSDADLAADQLICDGLAEHFPEDVIVSEETYHAGDIVPTSGRVWFVDPIDGTNDYVLGGNEYCVMIGLAIDQVPVLGVVYQPTTGKLWKATCHPSVGWGPVDSSLRWNDKEGRILISRHHPSPVVDNIIAQGNFSQVIQMSSVGLKLACIADGNADIYINPSRRLKLWDTCGPVAILRAAGGDVRAIDGREIKWGHHIEHGVALIFSCHSSEGWNPVF